MGAAASLRGVRVRFGPARAGGGGWGRAACFEALAPDTLLVASPDTGAEILALCLEPGSPDAGEWGPRGEAWIERDEGPAPEPRLEVLLRSDRVVWRPGRVLVHAAAARFDELLAGAAHFALHEAELRALEREVSEGWEVADRDVPLTHGVERAALARWGHVNERTERVARARLRFAEIEPRLRAAPPNLPGVGRRLAAELATQCEASARLEALDDRLEVLEDLYELANDRLSEFSYFRREVLLEKWVIALLALEVVLMVAELAR